MGSHEIIICQSSCAKSYILLNVYKHFLFKYIIQGRIAGIKNRRLHLSKKEVSLLDIDID